MSRHLLDFLFQQEQTSSLVQLLLTYIVIIASVFFIRSLFLVDTMTSSHEEESKISDDSAAATAGYQKKEDDESLTLQNYTFKQLQENYSGKLNPRTNEETPVYLSLNGTVFDVSKGRKNYGPGGPYEMFAGRECGAALAKMSFDEDLVDNLEACNSLTFGERDELRNWIDKFTNYRCYPVKGRLVLIKENEDQRVISAEELAKFDGSNEFDQSQYATAPIYVGAGDKVFDVSFGGVLFYGPGCSYNRFAGKDASRALAKMSFDPADINNTDTTDLNPKEMKILRDWINTFENRKLYPIVGRLGKPEHIVNSFNEIS